MTTPQLDYQPERYVPNYSGYAQAGNQIAGALAQIPHAIELQKNNIDNKALVDATKKQVEAVPDDVLSRAGVTRQDLISKINSADLKAHNMEVATYLAQTLQKVRDVQQEDTKKQTDIGTEQKLSKASEPLIGRGPQPGDVGPLTASGQFSPGTDTTPERYTADLSKQFSPQELAASPTYAAGVKTLSQNQAKTTASDISTYLKENPSASRSDIYAYALQRGASQDEAKSLSSSAAETLPPSQEALQYAQADYYGRRPAGGTTARSTSEKDANKQLNDLVIAKANILNKISASGMPATPEEQSSISEIDQRIAETRQAHGLPVQEKPTTQDKKIADESTSAAEALKPTGGFFGIGAKSPSSQDSLTARADYIVSAVDAGNQLPADKKEAAKALVAQGIRSGMSAEEVVMQLRTMLPQIIARAFGGKTQNKSQLPAPPAPGEIDATTGYPQGMR
jgi:hypothetical protein